LAGWLAGWLALALALALAGWLAGCACGLLCFVWGHVRACVLWGGAHVLQGCTFVA